MRRLRLHLVTLALAALAALAGGAYALWPREGPDHWEVEAHVVIGAPPAAIYPLLEDLARWSEWNASPRFLPEAPRRLGARSRGTGGELFAGEGSRATRVHLTACLSGERVEFWSELGQPTGLRSGGALELEDLGGRTRVRWSEHGSFGFLEAGRQMNALHQGFLEEQLRPSLVRLRRVVEGR